MQVFHSALREQFDATFAYPEREKVRALLIDDDPLDVQLIARLLGKSRQLDFSLQACPMIEDARSALAAQDFDILFIDYWLGLRTSIEFLLTLQREFEIPCILITGLDEPDIRRIAFRAGARAFLSKEQLTTQALESLTLAVLR